MPEDNECCACLSIILSDSVVKIDYDYYPQMFLEECKYAVKKTMNTINVKLNLDESDDDKSNESDEEKK